jgi:hypothetical protein
MNNNYKVWVMMNSDLDVVTEEYETSDEALNEMLDRGYTTDELHEGNYSLVQILSDGKCWLECLDEIDY